MDVIFFLVPISIIILVVAIVGFWWAVNSGQYDDLDRPATDILLDDVDHQKAHSNGDNNNAQ